MRDFTETKPFGAAFVGLGTLGTLYLAGLDSEPLVALSMLAMVAYYLSFSQRKLT